MTERMREILESRQAPGAIIRSNIAYQSPVDGRAITTHRARRYDLESNHCVDARQGKEMAEEARKHQLREAVSMEHVHEAAARLGVL